jgi:peptidoglycan biosynthesis protein MviN/MurJ (putative lipid II flippase)
MLAARLRDWLTLHYQSELGTVSFNSIENARTLTNLPIAFLGQIVSLVMLPFLSGVLHQGGAAEHRRVLENTIETLCLVSLPVVAVFLVLAPELVSLVFIPAEWDAQTTQFCYQAGLATRLISLAFTLMVLENILLPGLFSIKSLWWPILWGVAASFLQLVWLLGLARIRDSIDPLLVLLGVACAYPLSRVCKNGILLLVLRRKTGLFPGRRFLRTGLRLALILAGTLGACALAKLGTRAVLGGIPTQAGVSLLRYKLTLVVQLAIPGAVCGLAFLALTLALGYGHHLQSLIRNLRDRKRRQGNSDALSTPEA